MSYPSGMRSTNPPTRWFPRLDRDRVRAYLHFLREHFIQDKCFESAGALSFATLFALVPLTATVLGVISMFPVSQQWGDALTTFVFSNFVPKSARVVAAYLHTFADSARGLTGLGAIGVLVSAMLMMRSIEDAFNRIWRVAMPRRPLARFGTYWAALILGPLLLVSSLVISSYFFSLPFLAGAEKSAMLKSALGLTPMLLELCVFTATYKLIPNRTVAWRNALAGGALATALFELAKFAIAFYFTSASYQQIYGALAAIPFLMFWIWISWVVVLLGASLAASLSSFRYQPAALRLPPGYEIYALLRLLGRFGQARGEGRGLHSEQLHALEPMLTDDLLQHLLRALLEIEVIQRNTAGEWVLTRDLDQVPMAEIHQAAGLRVPISEVPLPCDDDMLGRAVSAALDGLRLPMRAGLQRDVGSIFRKHAEPPEDTTTCTPPSA
jgi:membrane protein